MSWLTLANDLFSETNTPQHIFHWNEGTHTHSTNHEPYAILTIISHPSPSQTTYSNHTSHRHTPLSTPCHIPTSVSQIHIPTTKIDLNTHDRNCTPSCSLHCSLLGTSPNTPTNTSLSVPRIQVCNYSVPSIHSNPFSFHTSIPSHSLDSNTLPSPTSTAFSFDSVNLNNNNNTLNTR